MNLVFVVYAFLLGVVMDIGSMIGTTEARTTFAGPAGGIGDGGTLSQYSR